MANYIATDTDLTSVANAIRTKGGTSEALEFPSEFVSAIGAIPTGGGLTLVASKEFTVDTSSTSAIEVGSIDCGSAILGGDKLVIVRVRDKAGKRDGYYYGELGVSSITDDGASSGFACIIGIAGSGMLRFPSVGQKGIYPSRTSSTGTLTISATYSSSSTKTINGTYLVEVFVISQPGGIDIYDGDPIT